MKRCVPSCTVTLLAEVNRLFISVAKKKWRKFTSLSTFLRLGTVLGDNTHDLT